MLNFNFTLTLKNTPNFHLNTLNVELQYNTIGLLEAQSADLNTLNVELQ